MVDDGFPSIGLTRSVPTHLPDDSTRRIRVIGLLQDRFLNPWTQQTWTGQDSRLSMNDQNSGCHTCSFRLLLSLSQMNRS